MGSTFFGLEIGKSGLFAQQSALHITGHNIANANTEGYTRQRPNMVSREPFPYPSAVNDMSPGQMGTGATIQSIQRLREEFLDLQFRGQNKHFGEWEAKVDTLEKIENIMNEPTDNGLQHAMDEFWTAWQKLTEYPNDSSARETLKQKAIAVTETFSFMDRSLRELQANIDTIVETRALEMDSIAKQIADLNQQISEVVPHGYVPNDLYDKRDVLLDRLSKMADIEVTRVANPNTGKDTGMINVSIRNGEGPDSTFVPLVEGIQKYEVKAEKDTSSEPNLYQVTIGDTQMNFKTGEMAGLIESRGYKGEGEELSGIIPSYLARLNSLASTLVAKVNEVHQKGMGLDGQTGINFFEEGGSASNMKLSDEILTSSRNIAAGTTGSASDTSIAREIYQLKEKSIIEFTFEEQGVSVSETTSFDAFTRSMISKLGIETQEAQNLKGNAEGLKLEVENRRQSVSGVSLDEEFTNMIRFQHAYNAAARQITAVDEMLDKIINGMGLVGR
jgi:flagellar hook-associated protein 1 FlgK